MANTNANCVQRFYGNIKWFEPADQPAHIEALPPEFATAKGLWMDDPVGNQERILALLTPFVGARFIPTNISGWEELFLDRFGHGVVEIESDDIRVVGIDFSRGPLPICKAEATFPVNVSPAFRAANLDEWQSTNGYFTDGIVFYWNVEGNESIEHLDFTAGDNQGVEAVVWEGAKLISES